MVCKTLLSLTYATSAGFSKTYPFRGNNQSSEKQSSTSSNNSRSSGNECSERSNSGDDTNIRPSYDTEPMAEVPYTTKYDVFAIETQHTGQLEFLNDTSLMEKVNSNTTPDSSDMYNNEFKDDQNADGHEDECVMLANLITNLKLVINGNKTIQKCRSALHHKEVELEKYTKYKNCQLEKEDIEQKNAEFVHQGSLENIRYDLLRKEKEQLQKDFKISQDKDIDKIFALENQVKFLNDVVYKTNQSVQTIHMLAYNPSSYYNGRESFVNPEYLKKAQSEKPCLYTMPFDKDDLANIFTPNSRETLILVKECRSKLDRELFKHYDYTYQNRLYELFTPQTQKSLDQLYFANEI
ncbi:hypothetical protein Tco_0830229 [Tanacetum coccineum]